ncbi:MAG: serine/threonine protein kinase, partial [Deltaproteobacteria bacterium]|nr:serine/threonine protein kinase [Kofleriaceae bacterium]
MTRYELLERIGAGRVAEIFRGKAVAAGGFEKPVAIKRILPHLSQDRRFVEALIAEAKVLSALRHRNIVQIFDVGLGDDGQNFLVMEFVEGVDLGALQRTIESQRKRLPVDLALHVGAEVCEALDHAQNAPTPDGKPMRLVHRDVTPSNVMVSRAGEVKLTDFGLAKRPDESTTTGTGLRGRYGYVSPEQAAGQPVDGRSDVFAVGVIVWELATGRRLFSGLPDFDALRAVREDRIQAPSEIDRTLPAELDAILAEALAREPRKRLPSAGELGKRLCREGFPVVRLFVSLRTLNPQVLAIGLAWRRGDREASEVPRAHSILESPMYLNSPIRLIFEGAPMVRRRIGAPSKISRI